LDCKGESCKRNCTLEFVLHFCIPTAFLGRGKIVAKRLTINSHTDALIISNAVREHCLKVSDQYHAHALKLLKEGKQEEAAIWFRYRDQVNVCSHRTLRRLEGIRKIFEDEWDGETYLGGGQSGCSGDVGARDTF
jgi:hypothetical protein